MGMAASQARLLSITARLTNNENSGQTVSYAKQRLADKSQQITNEYNEALDATKLTVLTGFNGAEANYTDISYNLMTGLQMAENTRQYIVTDTKGKVLVDGNIADAYEYSRGNYNAFLAKLGYSQADINVNLYSDKANVNANGLTPTQQQIHEAWDKYFATVGINLGSEPHDFGFSWTETTENGIGFGYAGYAKLDPEQPYDYLRDENGNPVTNKTLALDANGNAIYADKTDSEGNVIFKTEMKEIETNEKNQKINVKTISIPDMLDIPNGGITGFVDNNAEPNVGYFKYDIEQNKYVFTKADKSWYETNNDNSKRQFEETDACPVKLYVKLNSGEYYSPIDEEIPDQNAGYGETEGDTYTEHKYPAYTIGVDATKNTTIISVPTTTTPTSFPAYVLVSDAPVQDAGGSYIYKTVKKSEIPNGYKFQEEDGKKYYSENGTAPWTYVETEAGSGEYYIWQKGPNEDGIIHNLYYEVKEETVKKEVLSNQTTTENTGYPALVQKANDEGEPLFDEDGNPVYEQMKDDNGNLLYYIPEKVETYEEEFVIDKSKPNYLKDEFGNMVYDPINYEGTTDESRNLYDYAMALTEAYLRTETGENGVNFNTPYNQDDFKSAVEQTNQAAIKYYKNIFDKIRLNGYFTYTNTPAKVDENHIYISEGTGTKGNVVKNPLKDNYTFEAALRDGSLRLEYYSTTDKKFKSTTISEDTCIQEVTDERAVAKAESKYKQDMADLESKDNKFDLELRRLDTEHSALQTEYESVQNVLKKNVESSFKMFS